MNYIEMGYTDVKKLAAMEPSERIAYLEKDLAKALEDDEQELVVHVSVDLGWAVSEIEVAYESAKDLGNIIEAWSLYWVLRNVYRRQPEIFFEPFKLVPPPTIS